MQQPASIVVTGSSGLVGMRVIQRLRAQRYRVHAVVHQQPSEGLQTLEHNIVLHHVDLSSKQQDWSWLAEIQPVAVLHCAAMTNVDECERNPSLAYAVNDHATRLLALACVQNNIPLLMVSTDYVFDGALDRPGPYTEEDRVNPLNHYGRSKWYGELAVQEICAAKVPWTICRTSVVYGGVPGTHIDFTAWLLTRLRLGEVVKIVYDQVNTPTFSQDLARMLVSLIQRRATGIYHTAGSTTLNRYQFALALARHCELNTNLILPLASSDLAQAALRPLAAGLRTDKITHLLGIAPLSVADGFLRSFFKDTVSSPASIDYASSPKDRQFHPG